MKRLLYWSFFIIYIIGTLLLTTVATFDFVPVKYGPLRRHLGDMAHFVLLGGFALLTLLGLNIREGKIINWAKGSYWLAFVCAFFFGVFIEFLQSFTLARKPSWHDVVINSLGIVFVLTVIYFCSRAENYKFNLVNLWNSSHL